MSCKKENAKGVTTQMKVLDEDSLTILFMLLLKRVFKFLAKKKKT